MIEGMTAPATPLETLLAQAHAQPGEPQGRLSHLLSALEDADWTLLLASQEALAAQLASLLGPGLIRLDPRLSVNREAFASFGLALASSDGDWKGARAVWLLEPDERSLTRARRADVPVIVDATLAPGGRWLTQGTQLVVYRDAVTLTGLGDVQMSAVSGLGSRPRRVAAAPADLSVALALRDIGTLALRMNRRTRNAEALLPRFEGRALSVSGGVLLLEHDGPQTVTPLGGNLSAARAVAAGTLVTVGIESPDDSWAVLGAVLTEEARPARNRSWPQVTEPEEQPEEAFTEQPQRAAPQPQTAADPGASGGGLPVDAETEAQSETAELEDAFPEPAQTDALQDSPDRTGSDSGETGAVPDDAAQAAPGDFSDREFVFSPAPVLPDLPSLPNVVSLPSLSDDLPHDDGRPAPKRNRGRRGKAETAAQPAVQPEIVMSESFSRPPEPEQAEPAVAEPQSDEGQVTDQWPEEMEGGPEDLHGADASETETETLPLQLPPDLPTESTTSATDGLTDEQRAVYARLREWRNAEAKRQGLSSFIIASNATLAEVARLVPYTEADLAAVRGMGPERLRKYGQKILEVVRG